MVKRKEAAWKELKMKIQEKNVWKSTKKKGERLKDAYIKPKGRSRKSVEGK